MIYVIGGMLIALLSFFMAATQKARGYNFWRYFIVTNIVLWAILFMFKKGVTGTI